MLLKPIPSFESVYKQYRPALLHFSMAITKNMADAEEVVNDVFMAIWERRADILAEDGLKSYLFRAVKNRCLNKIKRDRLPFDSMPSNMPVPSKENTILQNMEARETEARLQVLIDRLPNKCKQVFLFSRKHEMSYKEIADLMDISPKTVENQIGLALKFLKENF